MYQLGRLCSEGMAGGVVGLVDQGSVHRRAAFRICALALVLGGCGSSPPPAAAVDAAMAGEGDAARDSGTYHKGVYTCCGPEAGLSCCTAEPGLLGYDILPDGAIVPVGRREGGVEANCFPYGGALGACAGDGVQFDGKDPCSICCPGLAVAFQLAPNPSDAGPACIATGPASLLTCTPCGDGVCQQDENHCSCPSDCP
jgi:hypothetical protein